MIGLHRDMVLEQGAWLGATVPPCLQLASVGAQTPIDLPRADASQLVAHPGIEMESASSPGQPERQERLQPNRPRIARRLPDHPQCLDGRPTIGRRALPADGPGRDRRRTVQPSHGVLAVIPGDLAELVQDPSLLCARRLPIPPVDRCQVLPSRPPLHARPSLGSRADGGYLTNGATIRAR